MNREIAAEPSIYLLVDTENVGLIDLSIIESAPVKVLLLLGERQKNLPVSFVKTWQQFSSKVELIEAGHGGRNALDMILCFYLGAYHAESPHAAYYIVSRDRDFDPLLRHLTERGIVAARYPGIEEVPGLATIGRKERAPQIPQIAPPVTKATATRRTTKAKVVDERSQPTLPLALPASAPRLVFLPAGALGSRVTLLIEKLRTTSRDRPLKRSLLGPYFQALLGNEITDVEAEQVIEALQADGMICISPNGVVTYRL